VIKNVQNTHGSHPILLSCAQLCQTSLNVASTSLRYATRMIDNFAIALTHGLMLFIAWKMLSSSGIDDEAVQTDAPTKKRWGR
jgi:hypothetical protein